MNLTTRRYQALTPYSYCRHPGCEFKDSGIRQEVEDRAAQHVADTMHQVRVNSTQVTIFAPADDLAAASRG